MRLEVTRKSHLAICAMATLAAAPQRVKTAELVDELNAAPAFLAQVLGEMVRHGWIDSSPGPTGGYQLLVDVAEVPVIDVIEAFEGPTDTDQCVVANAPCGADGHCALHTAWTEARSLLIQHLHTTTVEGATTRSNPDHTPDEGGEG